VISTIITKTTGGTTRSQGVDLGLTCQETATPKRSGSRDKTGSMTEIEAATTDVIDSDVLAEGILV